MRDPGAALVEIGNELLSGKVQDTNGPYLIRELAAVGGRLRELRIIADDREEIARTVRELSDRYEAVLTSGGVGPTHDDVTLAGIAAAFGEQLARNAELEAFVRRFYRGRVNEHLLRMADLPESAELLHDDRLVIPLVRVHNVYVLPGEPTVFRKKWVALRDRFRGAPLEQRFVYTDLDEGDLAGWLAEIETLHGVRIGSYPRYDTDEYAVMISIEAEEAPPVAAACAELVARIPPEALVRVEGGLGGGSRPTETDPDPDLEPEPDPEQETQDL